MYFLREILVIVLAASATTTALNVPPASAELAPLPGRVLRRDDPSSSATLEKRQSPVQIARFARTWFKVGKALFKDYKKQAEANDKDGAGFHRDFGDLVDTQLPDPPKPIESLDELFPDGVF